MTPKQAKWILNPSTTSDALAAIEYFAGFRGEEAKIKAVEEACRVACTALDRMIEQEKERDA